MIVYLARDIRLFVMYCVNGKPRSSLLIESTDSMITYSTWEKTFSSLKRIKTYLRPTMGDKRLSSLAVLPIERYLFSDIQMSDVLDNFASSNGWILL